jgi:hypothetical protein
MATRATYEFHEPDKEPVWVYIHWDGYPEGAARYFSLWLKKEDPTVLAFLKANRQGEVTEGHDAHGDTEYRYTVHLKGSTANGGVVPETWLKANEKHYGQTSSTPFHEWEQIYNGPLQEFVSKYDKVREASFVDIP